MARKKVERSEIIRFDAAIKGLVKELSREELANLMLDNMPYQKLLELTIKYEDSH